MPYPANTVSESPISHIRAEGAPPLLIRADAGGNLGTGHVMRMLALAQAWMAQGGKVVMAILSCPDPLLERLLKEGVEICTLDRVTRGSGDDAGQLTMVARSVQADWVVLDGYYFGLEYQRLINKAGFNLMVMADYGYCSQWCADLILNQNLGAENFTYENEILTGRTLLGPKFVLLRKEFWDVVPKISVPGKPIQKVLVTLGGVDADNVTGIVLETLEAVSPHPLELHVILGPGNSHRDELESIANSSRHTITYLQNVIDMPSQYQWAEGVISAGGSTCYEWMRFEVPAAVLCIADNQRGIVNALVSNSYAIELQLRSERLEVTNPEDLKRFLSGTNHPDWEQNCPINGQGAVRVCCAMQEVV